MKRQKDSSLHRRAATGDKVVTQHTWAAGGCGRPTASARGGGWWLSHRGIATCAWARTRGHGLSWNASKRALPLKLSLNFKISTNFVIQIDDLRDVPNSPNFAG
jgi:hypothetical protein